MSLFGFRNSQAPRSAATAEGNGGDYVFPKGGMGRVSAAGAVKRLQREERPGLDPTEV